MAGAEGFEPPLAVLETAGLPLNLRPCVLRTFPADELALWTNRNPPPGKGGNS
jgi:hypothetical protein